MSTNINIVSVWGERRGYEGETPELMVAWDENSVDENPVGFATACAKEAESWGEDLMQQRTIIIAVPADMIEAAFRGPVVQGVVVEDGA